jgi:outer membrane immunogenic protein
MTRRILIALCLAAILVTGAMAQDKGSAVTLNYSGAFSNTTTGNGIEHSTTKTGGFLGSYEYSFTPRQAFAINYGYTPNTQRYSSLTDFASIRTGVHEVTGSYFLKFPIGKITPFVQAGAGALVFKPSDDNVFVSTGGIPASQTKAVFVYGGGADYNLARNLAVRMQYRGLLYKTPDYGLGELTTDTTTHTASPSIGIVLHF